MVLDTIRNGRLLGRGATCDCMRKQSVKKEIRPTSGGLPMLPFMLEDAERVRPLQCFVSEEVLVL